MEFYEFTFLHECPIQPKMVPTQPCDDAVDEDKWNFPPANKSTVQNIASALLKNHQFYLRVLQIMKQMNLPPPFYQENNEDAQTTELQPSEIDEVEMEELYKEDTEESELEMDETIIGEKPVIPEQLAKPKKLSKHLNPLKKLKISMKSSTSKVKTTGTTSAVALSDVFEKTQINLGNKKLEVKISSSDVLRGSSLKDQSSNVDGFGTFAPLPLVVENPSESTEEQENDTEEFISIHKLQINKLQEEGEGLRSRILPFKKTLNNV